MKVQYIATAAFGLEAVVGKEIRDLGYTDQFVENGKVTFAADLGAIARTNLWCRSADRILIKVGEFKALSFDELFEQTKALPWEDWIVEDGMFPVAGKSIDSKLFSVPDCQAIVKKAIVERLKQKYRCVWFAETGSRYKIEVALHKDIATLTLDTSGAGLHKRGYRKLSIRAPLKETLASSLIQLSYWKHDRMLLDPFCGSGTIPIEAAMMGLNIAPGFKREFDAQKWSQVPGELWQKAHEEAKDKMNLSRSLRIQATDIDEEAISLSRYHAKQAGVDAHIHFQVRAMQQISSRFEHGIIITNPPYGERLGEEEDANKLNVEMGKVFRSLNNWSYYVISSSPNFEKYFGKKCDKKRKLFNGRIQCNYFQYYGPAPSGMKKKQIPIPHIGQFDYLLRCHQSE